MVQRIGTIEQKEAPIQKIHMHRNTKTVATNRKCYNNSSNKNK